MPVTPAAAQTAPDEDEVLGLDAVTVRRGTSLLLDAVDLRVHEGERWVVLGPNGAGKSTLLSVAAARLFPTTGAVRVLGERLGRVDVFELRPRIGLASTALARSVPGTEKVRDVVVTAAYGVTGRWREAYDPDDDARALQLLDLLGVAHLAERPFGTLSDGERKRTQIARALMTDPELLLLDEPAGGLDLGGREDLLRRLTALAADPAAPTTVTVTHHVEEIPVGTTHALLLRAGRAVAAGPVDDVLTGELLTRTFGLPLSVERRGGRLTALAV
ncbi:ABC transporter ATP-binding protein [Paenibacillus sp. TRM 82003]|uniref:ABC transporter ATP-binding protein n=1 Tax=Kineococcus sp. TRM81007 TaxID=2925831 RepID=UPI001F57E15D|nr:ABC transporter ATP-binding protein [Kineococcus sp. TRM81007]MCI2237665.1 ABC transporter ATP-binding protein [Kineococcus sp. TRM81007]MCI3921682.1 ABC transporter ATP-binding protein [Paenibacillus sp. TRM 82003]